MASCASSLTWVRRCIRILLIGLLLTMVQTRAVAGQGFGQEWSTPVDITAPGSDRSAFGTPLCDRYQNTYLLWSQMSDEGSELYYQDDRNGYWSTPLDVVAVPEPRLIRIDAGISPETDTLHVIWQNRDIGGDVYYTSVPLHATSDVRAWRTPNILVENAGANMRVDDRGIIHVAYGASENEGLNNYVYYLRSDDDGATWSTPIRVFSSHTEMPVSASVGLAVDDRQRIHAGITVRSQEYGVYSEVGYTQSTDGGNSWRPYETVQVGGTTFQGVSTIRPYAFGEDEVHLTWHDPRRMHRVSTDGGDSWSEAVEIMALGAAFGGENELVKDTAGLLHSILATGGGVFSVAYRDGGWGAPEQIDDRFIDPHGQRIVSCQGNRLHVVYYDRLGDNRVWYSTRETSAPPISREPVPTPTPVPPGIGQPAAPTSAERLVSPAVSDPAYPLDKEEVDSRALSPVITGTTIALLLIGIGWIYARMKP